MTDGAGAASDTFVMVPSAILDLVQAGKVSKNAAWLYVVLLSHLNQRRSTATVWPSRETLAEKLGLKRAASVDPLMTELKKAGLVTATEQRVGQMRSRNLYTLHAIVPARSAENRTTPRAGKTHVSAGGDVGRKTVGRSSVNRTREVRRTAPELDQGFEPNEEASLSDAAPREVTPIARERSSNFKDQDQDPRIRLAIAAGAKDAAEATALIPVVEKIAAVQSPGWWFTASRNGSLAQRVVEARGARPVAKPPKCGECDPNRFVTVTDERGLTRGLTYCPRCHPLAVKPASLHQKDEPYRNPDDQSDYDWPSSPPRSNGYKGPYRDDDPKRDYRSSF